MGSLPPSYDNFVSVIEATFRTTVATHLAISISTGSTDYIPPSPSSDNLIQSITDEYERHLLRQKAGKKDTENVAFYSNDCSKGNKGSSKLLNRTWNASIAIKLGITNLIVGRREGQRKASAPSAAIATQKERARPKTRTRSPTRRARGKKRKRTQQIMQLTIYLSKRG